MTGTTPPWLSADEQHAWRALVLGTQLLFDELDDDLRADAGLSMPEYEILVRLSESDGGMRMAALADAMAHSRSRVTHTVKRMESAGLIDRCNSPEDGRGVIARLTDRGWEVLRGAAPGHAASVRRHLLDHLTQAQLAVIGEAMDIVADRLIERHPEREMR